MSVIPKLYENPYEKLDIEDSIDRPMPNHRGRRIVAGSLAALAFSTGTIQVTGGLKKYEQGAKSLPSHIAHLGDKPANPH